MPRSLLVIDPVSVNRIRLAAILESAQYAVATAETPQEASRLLEAEPDLVLLGVQTESPGKAIEEVRREPGLSEAPVLCIDSSPSPMRRLQALRAGARDILQRAMPDGLLLARMRGLIREGDAERECERRRVTAASFGFAEAARGFEARARVACVGELNAFPALPSILAATTPHVFESLSLDDVLRDDANGRGHDAYVIVSGADYVSLDALMPELRDRSHSRHAPVMVLHPADRPDIATRALNLGASDIAPDSATGEELAIRIGAMLKRKRLRDTLRQSDEQSYRLAMTDSLTGLYNRRYAEAYLADLMLRGRESGEGFVLMLVDLDFFKEVNDSCGHASGDRVLREVAGRLRDNLRACDLVARYGGEEFLVVLPETDAGEAERTAERLRAAIAGRPVRLEDRTVVGVTASIGGAILRIAMGPSELAVRTGTFDFGEPRVPAPLSEAFEAADAALYRAKAAGRNRVEFTAV